MTRERISRMLERGEMLLSKRSRLVSTFLLPAVDCAILESVYDPYESAPSSNSVEKEIQTLTMRFVF